MALTRYIDDYQLSELEGVRFFMTEDGKTSIACRVSYEALQDLASINSSRAASQTSSRPIALSLRE